MTAELTLELLDRAMEHVRWTRMRLPEFRVEPIRDAPDPDPANSATEKPRDCR